MVIFVIQVSSGQMIIVPNDDQVVISLVNYISSLVQIQQMQAKEKGD